MFFVARLHALHESIVYSCREATRCSISHTTKSKQSRRVPGWTTVLNTPLPGTVSFFWHRLWVSNVKPESGWVFNIMRCTRSKYHYMVRNLKRTRDTQIRASLGRSLLLNGNRDYSRELKKIRRKIRSVTSVIDGFTESKDIANAFASKYSVLYNSVINPDVELQFMSLSIEQGIHTQCLQDCSFSHCTCRSKDDVIRAVKHLNPGKSGSASGVMSDSVIHGTNMLFEYITCLFNSMLRHGISPDEFLVSIWMPIPKGHRVDTGNSSNYRAVALSSIYGKILDNVILVYNEKN